MATRIGAKFEPAAVIPEQVLALRGGMQAEKRLMLAILEDAIAAARRPRGCREHNEAWHWIVSNSTSSPCSFVNVCWALGLDPAYLRRGLETLIERARDDDAPTRPLVSRARPSSGSRTRVTGSRTRVTVPRHDVPFLRTG
jgi:hypothetical protein